MYMKEQCVSAAERYGRQPGRSDYLMGFGLSSSLNRLAVRQGVSGLTVSTGNHNNFSNQSEARCISNPIKTIKL
jgi:hypothetical protein